MSAPDTIEPAVDETGAGEELSDRDKAAATLASLLPTGAAEAAAAVEEANKAAEPKLDAQGRAYATGKRKDAVARVWIKPGVGRVMVNGRDAETYFARATLRMVMNQPFEAADRRDQFDVMATVSGGGLSGQAGAVRHGISKALLSFEPGLRPILKKGGFLTRDSRVVERKKYGKAKGPPQLPVLETLGALRYRSLRGPGAIFPAGAGAQSSSSSAPSGRGCVATCST